jgi:hypothetical protein
MITRCTLAVEAAGAAVPPLAMGGAAARAPAAAAGDNFRSLPGGLVRGSSADRRGETILVLLAVHLDLGDVKH